MRLDALGLTRFGHFTDAQLVLPRPAEGPDLHIVFGPNEAGKSTLFAAWLDLLFGIGAQTPYAFLHDYRALRIEAAMTTATGPLHVARIKGNTNTLLDATSNTPLPEASLGAALGGLDRAGYTTMFSLDDDTLEAGGESILSSEGDLGRLLFSASAGLGDLSQGLRDLQAELDDWFRPGARKKTTLNAHKAELRRLEAERREVDLKASDWRKLCAARDAAQARYEAARAARSATQTALGEVARDLGGLRDLARLQRLEARLAGLPPPQDLPEDWIAALPDWQREESELAALTPVAEARLAELTQALESLPRDTAAEARVDQIDDLEQRFGAITKDMADLPRRRSAAADLAREMEGLTAQLGRPDLTPEAARLPAATMAALTGLIEEDAVLRNAEAQAQEERARARQALPADAGDTEPFDAGALARLSPLVAELKCADLLRRQTEAQAAMAEARAGEAAALRALSPWQGSPETLAALDLPAPAQLETLARALTATAQAARDAETRAAELQAQQAQARAALPPAATQDAGAAEALRATRDRAWAAHKAALDRETAETFEAAMAADDAARRAQIEAARLGERLTALAQLAATAEQAEAQQRKAEAAHEAQKAEVAQLWTRLGLAPEGRSLADFTDWMARRDKALAATAERARAEAQAAALDTSCEEARTALQATLRALGRPLPATDFATLMAEAEAVLLEASALQIRAERQRALRTREAALEQTRTDRKAWQQAWDAQAAACWIGLPAPDPPAMRAILDIMRALGERAPRAQELAQRIASMERDIAEFTAELATLARDLGAEAERPVATLWPHLRERLRAAQSQITERARLEQAKREATRELGALHQRRKALDARLAPVQAQFGQQSLAQIALTIDGIQEAQSVAADCTTLRLELAETCATPDPEAAIARLSALDKPTAEARHGELQMMLETQEKEQQSAYADLREAEAARDRAGHDGAAAQLDTARQTLIVQIAEEARRFLARQAGIIAVEQALRRYRDTHRSTMMRAASEAFATLTGGRYTGLVTQADGADDVLLAQAAGGATLQVKTLSKGTRFQLYLALRAAGFHEFVAHRPTVPFIADDILETFDDTRAEAAFRLLGQMATRGQVIYLTHHAHLCDIARAACPDVQIHDLRRL